MTHSGISLEQIKNYIGDLHMHDGDISVYHRSYLLYIDNQRIKLTQYQLDRLYEILKPFNQQPEEITE